MTEAAIAGINGTVLFCDEVRREDNGKRLFIGVYNGDLQFGTEWPNLAKLTAIISLNLAPDADSKGLAIILHHIESGTRKKSYRFELPPLPWPAEASEVHTLQAELPLPPLRFEAAGELRLEFRRQDQTQFIGDLKIGLHPDLEKRAMALAKAAPEAKPPTAPTDRNKQSAKPRQKKRTPG